MTVQKRRKRRGARRPGRSRPKAPHIRRKARAHARRIQEQRAEDSPPPAEAAAGGAKGVLRAEPEPRPETVTPAPAARRQEGSRQGTWLRLDPGGRIAVLLLPGLTFSAMGRPAAGLVCYALQASLVGWLPAVLWATSARRHVARKHRQIAARLH
jgi:hypothetical protein